MKYSIIVPVYNAQDCLRECLDSMVRQTEASWECICIDDGSKDASWDICQEYARRDARFRIVRQRNKGLTATRNVGLGMACGDYVCFLDCDDARRDDWLERADGMFQAFGVDMVRMGHSLWHGEEYEHRVADFSGETKVFRGRDEVFRWGWETFNRMAYVWLSIYRRSRLEGFRFEERRIYREDMVSSMHLIERMDSVAQSDYPACMYLIRPGSMMHSKVKASELTGYWDEFAKVLASHEDQMSRIGIWDDAKVKFTQAVLGSLRNWMAWRDGGEVGEHRVVAEKARGYLDAGLVRPDCVHGLWGFVFGLYCRYGWESPLYLCEKAALRYVATRNGLLGKRP